ncbi:MAG: SlyX family protein [Verrucomicrobiota bacterium]|nr:SlyX family protein [Verrucomicrobiota bacterium]
MPSARIDRPPRRVKLEERLAWLERHVAEQDKVILGLSEELKRLRAELKQFRERSTLSGSSEPIDQDERPPHY